MKQIDIITIGLMVVILQSCKKSEPDSVDASSLCTATYNNNAKSVFDAKCALPDCHATGTSLIDFTSYGNLKKRADNGNIYKFIFELEIMPPANATPLTDQEKETIKCWLDNEAPE